MNPKDVKYTETHEWARLDGDVVTIGITEHAAQSLSDLVYLGLPDKGDSVSAGDGFGEIESVKAVSDLKSPVDGEVVEVNDELPDNLATINEDPYGAGWMIKVRVKGGLPASLLDADAYEKLIAETA